MRITHIELKNWLNFRKVGVALAESTYVIGPNAAGKSNFLDVFRFLRTLSSPSSGGLSKAVTERGGLKKLRCLQARRDPEVRIDIEVRVVSGAGESQETWDYTLGFKSEGTGRQRPMVTEEKVSPNGKWVLKRPNKEDADDKERLTQTHLEQVGANVRFRALAEFFASTT